MLDHADPDVVRRLRHLDPGQRARFEAWAESHATDGFATRTMRVARPRSLWARLRGRRSPAVLGATVSKFGGEPYLEREADWPRDQRGRPARFLAQIEFAELRPHLPGLPLCGLLAIYESRGRGGERLVWRWYPHPDATRSIPSPADVPRARPIESRWSFESTRWLPAIEPDDLRAIVGPPAADGWIDPTAEDAVLELALLYGRRREHAGHQVLPGDISGFVDAGSGAVDPDMVVVLRIDQDEASGFGTGDIVHYVAMDAADLASGRFERARSCCGNT